MDRQYETILGIYARATGKEVEQLRRDMDRDYHLSAYEAQEYGLIDRVLDKGRRGSGITPVIEAGNPLRNRVFQIAPEESPAYRHGEPSQKVHRSS
jgi:hypothetical protein